MVEAGKPPIVPSTFMSKASMVIELLRDGVSTRPRVYESEVSGSRFGLPPLIWLYCRAGLSWMLPYWAAVTPVSWHCARVALGLAPAQGSFDMPNRLRPNGLRGVG